MANLKKVDALILYESAFSNICRVQPLTEAAELWLKRHTDGMWFGNALVVEQRYVQPLAMGMEQAGFVLGGAA